MDVRAHRKNHGLEVADVDDQARVASDREQGEGLRGQERDRWDLDV